MWISKPRPGHKPWGRGSVRRQKGGKMASRSTYVTALQEDDACGSRFDAVTKVGSWASSLGA